MPAPCLVLSSASVVQRLGSGRVPIEIGRVPVVLSGLAHQVVTRSRDIGSARCVVNGRSIMPLAKSAPHGLIRLVSATEGIGVPPVCLRQTHFHAVRAVLGTSRRGPRAVDDTKSVLVPATTGRDTFVTRTRMSRADRTKQSSQSAQALWRRRRESSTRHIVAPHETLCWTQSWIHL